MKNILVLAEHFPNAVQPWLLNWLIESIKRGNSVNIIAKDVLGDAWQDQVYEYNLLNKVEYYSGRTLSKLIPMFSPYLLPFSKLGQRAYIGLWKIIRSGFSGIDTPKELMRAISRAPTLSGAQYDIIHSHTLGMSYEYLFLKKVLNIPLVTSFHGLPPEGVPMLAREKLIRVFNAGDLFLVNTGFSKRQLCYLGCDPKKITILPQGINLEHFPFRPKNYPIDGNVIILTVGRFDKEKGHIYAINAVSSLAKGGLLLEYRIVGTGPEKDVIAKAIKELDMNDHIKLFDSMVGEELVRQYMQAHIFILPSVHDKYGIRGETQGVVIQEAQASGVIVIATKTGGIPECVIDGENAFLVTDCNSDAIADTIRFIIESPDNWHGWQVNSRRHIEKNYDIRMLGERLMNIYDSLISQYR